MATPIRDTPRDVLSTRKSNVPFLTRVDDEEDRGERRHDPGEGARVPAAAAPRKSRIFPANTGHPIWIGTGNGSIMYAV